jgi:hypothetical protein
VLQPLLVYAQKAFPVTMAAYLDDVTLYGSADDVSEVLKCLSTIGPNFGLNISSSKTIIWSPTDNLLEYSSLFESYNCSYELGVELLGSSVSLSTEFIQAVVLKRVNKCIDSLHKLMMIKDPQLCLLLLRACEGMTKLMYCWRTVQPTHLEEIAKIFDDEICKALRTIVTSDGPYFGKFQSLLSSLPVSLGGLGIQLPSDTLRFAYIASSISSFQLQQLILDLPAKRPYPDSVKELVNSYSTFVHKDDPTKAAQLSINVFSPRNKLQLFMARTFYESKHAKLMNHPYITNNTSEITHKFKGILNSSLQKEASCWLFALPNDGLGQRMTPLEFQAAIKFRLLMPQFLKNSFCAQNSCHSAMDIYGYHSLVCRGHLLARHNLVRDALFDLTQKTCFAPEKNANVCCLGFRANQPTLLRPADLLVEGDSYAQDCIDITVVSPIVTSNQGLIKVGDKAKEAEKNKIKKHEEACFHSGFGFKPFAMDIFGVLAPKSVCFLVRIVNKLIHLYDYPRYLASAIVYRRISFAVQLGVARQFLACYVPQDMI